MDLVAEEPIRPAVVAAELIPDVDMIQVDMEGTVVMAIALTKKATITSPKLSKPLDANQAIFSSLSAPPPVESSYSYLSISTSMAYCWSLPVM
jgi:hypothetical protein